MSPFSAPPATTDPSLVTPLLDPRSGRQYLRQLRQDEGTRWEVGPATLSAHGMLLAAEVARRARLAVRTPAHIEVAFHLADRPSLAALALLRLYCDTPDGQDGKILALVQRHERSRQAQDVSTRQLDHLHPGTDLSRLATLLRRAHSPRPILVALRHFPYTHLRRDLASLASGGFLTALLGALARCLPCAAALLRWALLDQSAMTFRELRRVYAPAYRELKPSGRIHLRFLTSLLWQEGDPPASSVPLRSSSRLARLAWLVSEPQIAFAARAQSRKLRAGFRNARVLGTLDRIIRGWALRSSRHEAFLHGLHWMRVAAMQGICPRPAVGYFLWHATKFMPESPALQTTIFALRLAGGRYAVSRGWKCAAMTKRGTLLDYLRRAHVGVVGNDFRRAHMLIEKAAKIAAGTSWLRREWEYVDGYRLALGAYSVGCYPTALPKHRPNRLGETRMLAEIWANRGTKASLTELACGDSAETVFALQDHALLALLTSSFMSAPLLRTLSGRIRSERSWLRRLICTIALMDGYRVLARAEEAVRHGAEAAVAYRGYRRLLRRHGVEEQPELLAEYERASREVLAALDPPRVAGRDPVATLVAVAGALRPKRRARPARTIDALDALVTIGRSNEQGSFDRRVARELAGMLGARILFRRRGRKIVRLRPQSEHTLSTCAVLRLLRTREVRAFRIRPRPEHWRPEQRRPGGVLVLPFGDGAVGLARRRAFSRRDVGAARTVLRFLSARLATQDREAPAQVLRTIAPKPRPPPGEGLIGSAPAWLEVLAQVRRVAEANCPVMLCGETGTGKERVARALHAASLRSRFAFVPVNCGALSPELLRSELFGHVRGAFTGAENSHEGLFARAHRGTLFFDEAAEMPPEMQVALLRALEEKEVRPLGSSRTIPVDVRVLTASSRDLERQTAAGRFREDLLHRLNVVRIDLPPLRERREDIPTLVAHLLARTPERATIHPDAMPILLRHDWPGNVRELDNVLRASAVLAEGREIPPSLILGVMEQRRRAAAPSERASPKLPARQDAILKELARGVASAPELAGRLAISVRTVNRDLSDLMSAGLVDGLGAARARRYGRTELARRY